MTHKGHKSLLLLMDTSRRSIVGSSINTVQDAHLAINALNTAISQRGVRVGGIEHADHGVQLTSWPSTEKVRNAGFMPSCGSVGDPLGNAVMRSFRSSMQSKLLDRKLWPLMLNSSMSCSLTSKFLQPPSQVLKVLIPLTSQKLGHAQPGTCLT